MPRRHRVISTALLVLVACATESRHTPAQSTPSSSELHRRNSESVAKDPVYESSALATFIKGTDVLDRCSASTQPPSESFTIFIEIMPDGSAGTVLAEPLTKSGDCFAKVAKGTKFPPPADTFVVELTMEFKNSGAER